MNCKARSENRKSAPSLRHLSCPSKTLTASTLITSENGWGEGTDIIIQMVSKTETWQKPCGESHKLKLHFAGQKQGATPERMLGTILPEIETAAASGSTWTSSRFEAMVETRPFAYIPHLLLFQKLKPKKSPGKGPSSAFARYTHVSMSSREN